MAVPSNFARVLKSVPFWVLVGVLGVFAIVVVVLYQSVTRGPAAQYDLPIEYEPVMAPDSLSPAQSEIILREGGGALLTRVLLGELEEDDRGVMCVRPSGEPYSGAATWTADDRTRTLIVRTDDGEATFYGKNGRFGDPDWGSIRQFVCSSGEAAYGTLNDGR